MHNFKNMKPNQINIFVLPAKPALPTWVASNETGRRGFSVCLFFLFLLFFYGVVVVIATAGAEAAHRQEGQTWLSLALDDGVHPASAAAPTTDGKTEFRWHRFHRSDYLTLAVHT